MKTTLVIVLVGFAALVCGQEKPASKLFSTTSASAWGATKMTLTGGGDISLYATHEFLSVRGMRQEPKKDDELWARYIQPTCPDEIVIVLTTKDGRKWRAKWDEVVK